MSIIQPIYWEGKQMLFPERKEECIAEGDLSRFAASSIYIERSLFIMYSIHTGEYTLGVFMLTELYLHYQLPEYPLS